MCFAFFMTSWCGYERTPIRLEFPAGKSFPFLRLIKHTEKLLEDREEKLCIKVLQTLREMMTVHVNYQKVSSCFKGVSNPRLLTVVCWKIKRTRWRYDKLLMVAFALRIKFNYDKLWVTNITNCLAAKSKQAASWPLFCSNVKNYAWKLL